MSNLDGRALGLMLKDNPQMILNNFKNISNKNRVFTFTPTYSGFGSPVSPTLSGIVILDNLLAYISVTISSGTAFTWSVGDYFNNIPIQVAGTLSSSWLLGPAVDNTSNIVGTGVHQIVNLASGSKILMKSGSAGVGYGSCTVYGVFPYQI